MHLGEVYLDEYACNVCKGNPKAVPQRGCCQGDLPARGINMAGDESEGIHIHSTTQQACVHTRTTTPSRGARSRDVMHSQLPACSHCMCAEHELSVEHCCQSTQQRQVTVNVHQLW